MTSLVHPATAKYFQEYVCKYLQNMTVQAKEILHGLMAYSILQVYEALFFYLQEYCSK